MTTFSTGPPSKSEVVEHLPSHPWNHAADPVLAPGHDRTDQWHALRRTAIGASEVSAALNLSRWSNPLRVYLDKLGRLPPVEVTEDMDWGIRLEDVVAQRFSDETGLAVIKTGTWRSRQWPWLLANPDRALFGTSDGLECKTADAKYLSQWAEGPPLMYRVQCMACMAVTGAQRWHIAALIGGNRFVRYIIDRDEDDIAAIVETTRRLWNDHIQAEVPPRVQHDASVDESALMSVLFPAANGTSL